VRLPRSAKSRAKDGEQAATTVLLFTPLHIMAAATAPGHCSTRNPQMVDEDIKAEVERLRAENEQLKSQRGRSVSLKVSEKGGVSVYGLGRFPVTLYKEQWTKLLALSEQILDFIKEHDAELKARPE
jgi:hypothetical protein